MTQATSNVARFRPWPMTGVLMINNTVIIVEDDRQIRYGLKLSFQDAGYAVIDGTSLETIAAMLNLRKSLTRIYLRAVVADFWLDLGINGVTVIRCMEKLWGKGFRSVLITGDHNPAIADRARAAGMTLLRKPFRFEELLAHVESNLCLTGSA
jgi:DNA-binding NtrC family response regulator